MNPAQKEMNTKQTTSLATSSTESSLIDSSTDLPLLLDMHRRNQEVKALLTDYNSTLQRCITKLDKGLSGKNITRPDKNLPRSSS
ncbi:uncharacterized protein BDW43DRAFT_80531 [Aspergillus alliaceus]|uniref:uncharacterized protein n=1 Tax=Petromyces alliaceus TaxID=209559 RepID=UPI0012A55F83|nr:uncharacterized protein BDW43DRAFT_80531 [Aspergillus alliaceus]KAB8233864.1 hypothetical protein BDW43DRAFT_80531 [Aspergillus alliaceus]